MKKRTKIMLWLLAFFGPVWWIAPVGLMGRDATLSEKTTRITSPLKADGTPDYAGWHNAKYGAGVTPENNAACLLIDGWPFTDWQGEADVEQETNMRRRLGLGERDAAQLPLVWFDEWVAKQGCANMQEASLYQAEASAEAEALTSAEALLKAALAVEAQCWQNPSAAAAHPDWVRWMQSQESARQRIVAASKRSYFFVPLEADALLINQRCPWLGLVKRDANFIKMHAVWCAGQGRFDAALEDVRTTQRLAQLHDRYAPNVIGALVAMSLHGLADQTIVLVAQALPQESQDWASLEALAAAPEKTPEAMRRMMDGAAVMYERDMVLEIALDWRHAKKTMDAVAPQGMRQFDFGMRQVEMDTLLLRLNAMGDAAMAGRRLETGDKPALRYLFAGAVPPGFRRHYLANTMAGTLAGIAALGMDAAYANIDKIHISHRHLPLALALSKYRQDHARYPAALAQLVPKYISSLPEAKHDFGSVAYRTAGQGKGFAIGYVKPDDLERYEKTGHGLREFFTSPGYEALQEADEKAEENAKANGE